MSWCFFFSFHLCVWHVRNRAEPPKSNMCSIFVVWNLQSKCYFFYAPLWYEFEDELTVQVNKNKVKLFAPWIIPGRLKLRSNCRAWRQIRFFFFLFMYSSFTLHKQMWTECICEVACMRMRTRPWSVVKALHNSWRSDRSATVTSCFVFGSQLEVAFDFVTWTITYDNNNKNWCLQSDAVN